MKQWANIYLIFIVVIASSAKGQPGDDPINNIQNLIIDLQVTRAQEQINSQVIDAPIKMSWLKGYLAFIKYQTATVEVLADETAEEIHKQVKNIKKYNGEMDCPFYLADLYLMNAFINFQNQEYFFALNHYLKAQKHINNCHQLNHQAPNCYKFKLIEWAVQAWIKENIPFFSTGQVTGNIQGQFEDEVFQLLINKEIPNPQKREIALLAGLLHPYFESDPVKSFQFVRSFYDTASLAGPLESFVFAKAATKGSQFEMAIKVLTQSINLGYHHRLNRINLMLGNLLANSQQVDAKFYLRQYISNQKNKKGVLYAQLKLMWVHRVNQNHEAFAQLKQNLVKPANLNFMLDKQAAFEIKDSANWTRELILSRQLFDAGYYQLSLKTLLNIRPKLETYNQNQRLAYAYRIGRAYHLLEEYDKALLFYKIALHAGLDESYYYPAYAAFYAGEIANHMGNVEMAKNYFNRCLQLDSPIYKTSIHHRAKSKIH